MSMEICPTCKNPAYVSGGRFDPHGNGRKGCAGTGTITPKNQPDEPLYMDRQRETLVEASAPATGGHWAPSETARATLVRLGFMHNPEEPWITYEIEPSQAGVVRKHALPTRVLLAGPSEAELFALGLAMGAALAKRKEHEHRDRLFDDGINPEWLRGINQFVLTGREQGGALMALIAHDFDKVLGRGDTSNLRTLRGMWRWMNCNIPRRCHGSWENVSAWAALTNEERADILVDWKPHDGVYTSGNVELELNE